MSSIDVMNPVMRQFGRLNPIQIVRNRRRRKAMGEAMLEALRQNRPYGIEITPSSDGESHDRWLAAQELLVDHRELQIVNVSGDHPESLTWKGKITLIFAEDFNDALHAVIKSTQAPGNAGASRIGVHGLAAIPTGPGRPLALLPDRVR